MSLIRFKYDRQVRQVSHCAFVCPCGPFEGRRQYTTNYGRTMSLGTAIGHWVGCFGYLGHFVLVAKVSFPCYLNDSENKRARADNCGQTTKNQLRDFACLNIRLFLLSNDTV